MPITLDCWLVAMNATISGEFINKKLFVGIRKGSKHLFYQTIPSCFKEFGFLLERNDFSLLKDIILGQLFSLQGLNCPVAWIEKNQEIIWTEKTQEVIELFFIDKRLELTLDENDKNQIPS